MIRRFARPYAKAMMELVPSAADAKEILIALEQFESTRRRSAELAGFYANPSVESAAKSNVTSEIATRLGVPAIGLRFLDVLIRNSRINDLGAILEAWRAMLNEASGVSIAKVRTAHALDEAEILKLRGALERRFGRTIELDLTTDPQLLGGFVAQLGSEIYDASVLGRITKFRSSLT